jgi:hypothetical protein
MTTPVDPDQDVWDYLDREYANPPDHTCAQGPLCEAYATVTTVGYGTSWVERIHAGDCDHGSCGEIVNAGCRRCVMEFWSSLERLGCVAPVTDGEWPV